MTYIYQSIWCDTWQDFNLWHLSDMQLQDKIKTSPHQLEMNRRPAFYQYESCCSVDIYQKKEKISLNHHHRHHHHDYHYCYHHHHHHISHKIPRKEEIKFSEPFQFVARLSSWQFLLHNPIYFNHKCLQPSTRTAPWCHTSYSPSHCLPL